MAAITLLKTAPSQDVIEMLEKLLECAREGKIVSVAYAYESAWSRAGTGYALGPSGDASRLLGGVSQLLFRINSELAEPK